MFKKSSNLVGWTRLFSYLKWLNQFADSICSLYTKISIVAQFSLDIMPIQFWELLLRSSDEPEYTHMNALNQINGIYVPLKTSKLQNINFKTQFILEISLIRCFESLWACLIRPTWNDWINLSLLWMSNFM